MIHDSVATTYHEEPQRGSIPRASMWRKTNKTALALRNELRTAAPAHTNRLERQKQQGMR